MARRRRRHHSKSHHAGNMIVKALPYLAGAGSFLQQITQKDVQSAGSGFTALSGTNKAQFIGADVLYRFTGINAAPTVLTSPGAWGINPKGILNKWVGLGIAGMALSAIVPGKYLPAKGAIKKVSGAFILGGAVGGLFDNPPAQTGAGTPNAQASYYGSINNRMGKGSTSGVSSG